MKKYILILIGIIVTTILLTAEFYIGYEIGYQKHKMKLMTEQGK